MITEAEHIIIEKLYIQHVTLTERRSGERGRAEPRSHDSAVQTRRMHDKVPLICPFL